MTELVEGKKCEIGARWSKNNGFGRAKSEFLTDFEGKLGVIGNNLMNNGWNGGILEEFL